MCIYVLEIVVFVCVEPVPMPISPISETGMSPSSESRVSQAGGMDNSSQGAAITTEAIQQEGILPHMPELLPQNELTMIFMKSCSRKNMSVHLTRRLFSEEVRMTSNVSGCNK